MTLNDLTAGEYGVITRIELDEKTKQKLFDMGVCEGTTIRFLRTAPLGDPIEFRALNFNLCIRKREAKMIFVERRSDLE